MPPSARENGALKDYVERQLMRFIAHDPKGLRFEYRSRRPHASAPTHELWWTVESAHFEPSELLLDRHYLLEARVAEQQFVIWFGTFGGFPGPTVRDVIQPAIHVPFSSVGGDRTDGRPASRYSLCDVLLWMHQHQYSPGGSWDSVAYPMSGSRY